MRAYRGRSVLIAALAALALPSLLAVPANAGLDQLTPTPTARRSTYLPVVGQGGVGQPQPIATPRPGASPTPAATHTPTAPSPTNTPTPPTQPAVDLQLPKGALPDQIGVPASGQFFDLRTAVQFNMDNWDRLQTDPAFRGAHTEMLKISWIKAHPTKPDAECVDAHDRFWAWAPDGKAYYTWHPNYAVHPSKPADYCYFGHEHGLDPRASVLITDAGGLPPFGFVLEQHQRDASTHHNGVHRREDHVGHKVQFANAYTATIGNSANRIWNDTTVTVTNRLYDAGFKCSFLSKIHQGSHSTDAIANHLHEYYLALRCDDAGNTFFTIKMLQPIGRPNEIRDVSLPESSPEFLWRLATTQTILGFDSQPIPTAQVRQPARDNSRELAHYEAYEWKTPGVFYPESARLGQIDLWTQVTSIETQKVDGTKGSLAFGPYYIVKNPVRTLDRRDGTRRIVRTIDICYDTNGVKRGTPFCAAAPATKPAWNSAANPMNGTFRAVMTKGVALYHDGGLPAYCTNVFGQQASALVNGKCTNPYHILQRTTPVRNGFGELCAPQDPTVCGVSGSLVNAQRAPDKGYFPQGIGFEILIDMRNAGPNGGRTVIYGEN